MKARIVAPSSALGELKNLQAGLELLGSWGIQLELPQIANRRWGYLAGSDGQRLADFDATADLWACARGGWGAARLLELGWQPPEGLLLGFSDVTSLLWAHQASGRLGALHGPLVTTLAGEPTWSQERLRLLLQGAAVPPLLGRGWGGGKGEGPLLVANLTVATHLLGSRWCPDLEGAVLILEDVGEAPYRIDRMLTHWRLCGALQKLAAIGFGSFEGCDQDSEQGFQLEQVLQERTESLGIPRLAGLPVGHGSANAVLPLGRRACLDGDRGLLSLAAP